MKEIAEKVLAKIKAIPQKEFDQLVKKYREDPVAIALRAAMENLKKD